MKHLSIVMIFLLWFSVFACTNDLSQQHETEQENPQGIEQGQPEQPEIKEPEISGEEEREPVTPEVEQLVIEPQEEKLPIVEPPVVVLPEEKSTSPEIVPPEIRPPNEETPEIEQPEIESPEIEPLETESPEVIPLETEPPEVILPVVEFPKNDLIINELKTESSSILKHAEFIEFKVMNACNLSGISVHIMNKEKNHFFYNFPNIDVSKGEYITLHLQTLENNCKDELGNNLALSGGIDSCPTARDLWVADNKDHLNSTDIVYLQDSDGKIIDAVVLNKQPSSKWDKSLAHFEQIMELLFNEDVWGSKDGEKPTPYDAVDTSLITNINRSVCRYEWRENHFNATDWYISGIGNFTPGLPNK